MQGLVVQIFVVIIVLKLFNFLRKIGRVRILIEKNNNNGKYPQQLTYIVHVVFLRYFVFFYYYFYKEKTTCKESIT